MPTTTTKTTRTTTMALLKVVIVRRAGRATRDNETNSLGELEANGKWRRRYLNVVMDDGI
jgi:hypothetical protein